MTVLLLFALAALLGGCSSLTQSWKAPEVELLGLQPKTMTLTQQVLIARLKLRNPNDRTLPIKAMTYRLSLEGQELAEGAGELDRQIPAHGEATVDVDVVGNLLSVTQQLPLLLGKNRPLDWTVTGTASIAGGLLTLPYRYSGQVDAQDLISRAAARGAR